MKKIMTLAIMAFLVGGIAFNANAQSKKILGGTSKVQDWTEVLNEYEQAVNTCVAMYQKMQKDDKYAQSESTQKEFQVIMKTAENLKAKLNKNANQLDKKQGERFNALTKKLSQVYIK